MEVHGDLITEPLCFENFDDVHKTVTVEWQFVVSSPD